MYITLKHQYISHLHQKCLKFPSVGKVKAFGKCTAEDLGEDLGEVLSEDLSSSRHSSARSSAKVVTPRWGPRWGPRRGVEMCQNREISDILGVNVIYFGNSKLINSPILMKRNPCYLYWYSSPSVQKRLTQCLIRNVTLLCAHINDRISYSDGGSLELVESACVVVDGREVLWSPRWLTGGGSILARQCCGLLVDGRGIAVESPLTSRRRFYTGQIVLWTSREFSNDILKTKKDGNLKTKNEILKTKKDEILKTENDETLKMKDDEILMIEKMKKIKIWKSLEQSCRKSSK